MGRATTLPEQGSADPIQHFTVPKLDTSNEAKHIGRSSVGTAGSLDLLLWCSWSTYQPEPVTIRLVEVMVVQDPASANYSVWFGGYQSKLEGVRRRYLEKISAQPDGYREQLISDLKGKYKVHPSLQEELVSEWDLGDASDT